MLWRTKSKKKEREKKPTKKQAEPKKKMSTFKKILTAEGWRRMMKGRSRKTKAGKK